MSRKLPLNRDGYIKSNISRASLFSVVTSEEYVGRLNAVISNLKVKYEDKKGKHNIIDCFDCNCNNMEVKNIHGIYEIYSESFEEHKQTILSTELDYMSEFVFEMSLDYFQDSNAASVVQVYICRKKDFKEEINNSELMVDDIFLTITPRGKLTIGTNVEQKRIEIKNLEIESGIKFRIITEHDKSVSVFYSIGNNYWVEVDTIHNVVCEECYEISVYVRPKINPFFYDFFVSNIQLCCTTDTMIIAPHFESYERVFSTSLQSMQVPMSMLEISNKEIVNYFVNLIENKYYINLGLNEYYIPGRSSYHIEKYIHVNFVYGVDTTRKIFYVLGFDTVLKYSKVSYDEFYLALQREIGPTTKMNLYKYDSKRYPYKFNVDMAIKTLEAYIEGENCVTISSTRRIYIDEKEPLVYGMKIYDFIIEQEINLEKFIKDRRVIYQIYEHITIMIKFCEFIRYIGLLENNKYQSIVSGFQKAEQEATIILNMILKNNRVNGNNILQKIKEKMERLRNCDKQVMQELLKELKNIKNGLTNLSIWERNNI